MSNKIIAIDFDGTLCTNNWPEIGDPNFELIDCLLAEQKVAGSKLILWTCRTGDQLDAAVKWCQDHGLYFDAVNDNLPEQIEMYGNNSRKIFADIYVDDKSLNPTTLR